MTVGKYCKHEGAMAEECPLCKKWYCPVCEKEVKKIEVDEK